MPITLTHDIFVNFKDETVLILGDVLPDTFEYGEGCRFFDCSGGMYKEDGSFFTGDPTRAIKRIATGKEISGYNGSKPRICLDSISDHPWYAPTDRSDFTVCEDGQYINRMGYFIPRTQNKMYSPTGKSLGTTIPSMNDIVYQVIIMDEPV